MRKLIVVFALLSLRALAVSGCSNLTLATGWKCVDSNAISGAGSNPTVLSLVHNSAVNKGDIVVVWANLVTTSWTTQSIAITDNAGNTLTPWSLGMHSYSNPANQWVGEPFYGIASANKASGYQATCTVSNNGGATATCDDFSVTIIRPPQPAATLAEDTTPLWIHDSSGSGGNHPNLAVPPSGQTLTTVKASLVLGGGNSENAPTFVDSPFVGIDGDGVFAGPMYYLTAAVQSTAGAISSLWYLNAASTSVGSILLPLDVGLTPIYVAQSAGTFVGGTACNGKTAITPASFNALTLTPGQTVYLCGTITGSANSQLLKIAQSGVSGSPISLLFDTGAVVQAPYGAAATGAASCGGIVCAQGQSWIVIDGQNTGIVQNTANGTALANQQNSLGVDVHNCSNCTVKNLTIRNIYVRTSATDTAIDETQMACLITTGSNILITNNTFDQAGWCLKDSYTNGDTNVEWSLNKFTNTAHSMMFAAAATNAATNIFIHDNDFGGPGTTWDGSGCPFHQDGIHVFGVSGSSIDNFYFYNNYMHGDWGQCPTGWIFVEAAGSGTPANMKNSFWWNNVGIVNSVGQIVNTNGWFNVSAGNTGSQKFFDNTIIGPNATDNTLCLNLQNLSGAIVENNTISTCGDPIRIDGTITTLNFNMYGPSCQNGGNCFVLNGSFTGSFASWKTATGKEANSLQTNSPLLNTDGSPQSSSPAKSAATNLSAQATGSLATLQSDTTKGGTRTALVRPSGVTAWDIGAYQAGAGFSASPTTIPSNHSANIAITLTGSGTTWTGSTAFSISGVTGATLVSKSNSSATSETLQITTGSGAGTLTITDTTDSISTPITIAVATLSASPSLVGVGKTPTITLTGTNTLWSSETAAGLFSVSGGTGASIGTPSVTSNTTATATLTVGSSTGTLTITDNSTTATATTTAAFAATPTCDHLSGSYTGSFSNKCSTTTAAPVILCWSTTTTPVTNGLGTGCTTGTALLNNGSTTISTTESFNIVAGSSTLPDSSVQTYNYVITPTGQGGSISGGATISNGAVIQ